MAPERSRGIFVSLASFKNRLGFLKRFRKLISERNTELGVREESRRDLTYLLLGRV